MSVTSAGTRPIIFSSRIRPRHLGSFVEDPACRHRMNEFESQLVSAFIAKNIRDRYRFLLCSSDPRKRSQCLDRLNHCDDFDPRFVTWLPQDPRSVTRKLKVADLLRQRGSPECVYVMTAGSAVDGTMISLSDALHEIELAGWGALISCIPGKLAYYYDEQGQRHAILVRTAKT
jgi:hypothetical protein